MGEESENKTERVQLLMGPSELKDIDDWGFQNRIRSRAEAIRRLCQIGLIADATPSMILAMRVMAHYIPEDRVDADALEKMKSGASLETDVKRLCWAVFRERSQMAGFITDDIQKAFDAAKVLAADFEASAKGTHLDTGAKPPSTDADE